MAKGVEPNRGSGTCGKVAGVELPENDEQSSIVQLSESPQGCGEDVFAATSVQVSVRADAVGVRGHYMIPFILIVLLAVLLQVLQQGYQPFSTGLPSLPHSARASLGHGWCCGIAANRMEACRESGGRDKGG